MTLTWEITLIRLEGQVAMAGRGFKDVVLKGLRMFLICPLGLTS